MINEEDEWIEVEPLTADEETAIAEAVEEFKEENAKPEKDTPVYYVDKAILYAAYVDWYKQCDIAAEQGLERPELPRYISESILKVCHKLASRFNFANYPFRDEMVGDAIENIYRYVDRFNVNKSENPFGYFSLIAFRAMVRRIKEEKKKAAVKYHYLINSGIMDTIQTQQHDDAEDYQGMLQLYQMNANDSLANVLPPPKKRKIMEKRVKVDDVEKMLSE